MGILSSQSMTSRSSTAHPSDGAWQRIRLTVATLAILALLAVSSATADTKTAPMDEFEVKAAFLLKFPAFGECPKERTSTEEGEIVIGILGKDPFGEKLDRLVQKANAASRKVRVQRAADPNKLLACHIVFIADSERNKLRSTLKTLAAHPILTVSGMPGFCGEGGIVATLRKDNTVKLEINRRAAEGAGLKLSSKLLRVAKLVGEDGKKQ